ncbi:MAG TPA: carbohydrate binding family 9 domain-containing protein, partial [Gemmatimonadales bacterium]
MSGRRCALAALLGLALGGAAAAQGRGRPAIPALAITAPVRLDGRLDEPFWAASDSLDDFRQREPQAGLPATERTVVRVARDAQALYIAIRCTDAQPGAIRSSQLRRDADLSSDDNVQILIDSFDDRRDAFVFGTNPGGAMWDAQFSGVDDLNENWNGVWTVAVARDAGGWTAEFRI